MKPVRHTVAGGPCVIIVTGPAMTPNRTSGQFVTTRHVTQVLAFLAVSCALVIGVRYGTLAMSGPESTCAVVQARMLSEGQRRLPSPLPGQRFGDAPPGALALPGFVTLTDGSDQSVPGCPAGLSVAMAAAVKLGGDAALFLVVPLFGMLAVWSTFLLARMLAEPWAGVAAATLLVCNPLFMHGVSNSTSDVPTSALWMACLAVAIHPGDGTNLFRFRRAIGAGLLAGLAMMLRPHLFPVAAVPIILVTGGLQPDGRRRSGETVSRSRLLVAALMGMLPGVASLAWLQWRTYGMPFGSATPWQDAWAPISALPVLVVLAVVAIWSIAGRIRLPWRIAVLIAFVSIAGGWSVHNASERGIFRAKAVERKYREVGRYAAAKLPTEAVILAALPAGSIRYYGGTATLTWSAIPGDSLDRLLDDLRSRGYAPFIVLDASEREAFKTRFGRQSALAGLDWTARATIGRDIAIYDPADRTRFLAGEHIPTESISWPR